MTLLPMLFNILTAAFGNSAYSDFGRFSCVYIVNLAVFSQYHTYIMFLSLYYKILLYYLTWICWIRYPNRLYSFITWRKFSYTEPDISMYYLSFNINSLPCTKFQSVCFVSRLSLFPSSHVMTPYDVCFDVYVITVTCYLSKGY